MTVRGALTAAAALAACASIASAGLAVSTLLGGPTASFAVTTGSTGPAPIQSAVVNINGIVPGGWVAGTGMLLTADGTVLTNNHVVAGTTSLTAQIGAHGHVYTASVVGVDPRADVAVIRLEGASHLPVVPIETSGVVGIGDDVTAMGNALGKNGDPVVVTGKVLSLSETVTVLDEGDLGENTLSGLIQMSAPIQPGDSGGPLVDTAGNVIGMDTAASATQGGAGASMGEAIPIGMAMDVVHQILGGVKSPFIQSGHSGVPGMSVTDAPAHGGAQVTRVVPGEPADGAGIAKGAVVTSYAGTAVSSAADCERAALEWRPGDRVVVIWHGPSGDVHQAALTLSPGPPA